MVTTYELHALTKDRWNIERVYKSDQKAKALEEAKQLNQEKHVSAVKLVSESFDERTNQSREVVIFDTTKPVRSEPTGPTAGKQSAAKSSRTEKEPVRRKAQRKKSEGSVAKIVVLLIAAAATIAVLLILLSRGRELFQSVSMLS